MGLEGLQIKCTCLPFRLGLADVFSLECRIVSAADKFAFITHTLGLKWED